MPGLASSHRAAHDMNTDKQIIITVMRKVKIGYQNVSGVVVSNPNLTKISEKLSDLINIEG